MLPNKGWEKSKGAITLIGPDDGIRPLRAGTDPGTAPSLSRLIKPIMARRPLLISVFNFWAFHSSLLFLLKPNGSYRLRGTGCGRSGPPSASSRVPIPDCPFTPFGRLNGGK